MVQILVLGPPEIHVDGRSLELRDRKGVGLLAYLATEGRTQRDKLADLFWSEMNQADARRNLRQRLYELKGKLPEGFLNTDGDSVSLEPNAQTDLAQFRAHIANGDDEAAVTLWRDSFLQGLELPGADGFDEWLEPTREELNTAFHEALRRLAVAREERGDLRGALEAHQRLLEADELQEFHQRESIRLLEALGERENALRQYERYRQTLEQELGDMPLPQTQQLAERVLHAIRRASDAPTAELDVISLELRSPLVGREAEWARLERVTHGLALIAGEPGIGKSRLADELAFYVARNGAVRRLQGREGSSGSPLYPVAECLREAMREPAWVQTLEPVWRTECARLVPEIDPQATPQPMPSLEGRVRFIEGLARALVASAGENGVIVLDDLHWFDAATLELVGHLTRRARDANVRLIAAARTEELERNEAAMPILADLKRDGLLTRLDLEPLQERDVRSLIQSLSGGRDAPAFAKRLHSATVGNPFFLLETLRDLFGSGQLYVMADGTWTTPYDDETETYAELPIPATVRETVIARVNRTGADARRLLEAASLAGDGFDLALVSSATALTEWEGVEAIERAVDAELLEPVNDGYRFNHDLIRRALEDGLNPDRRKLIHRKLAVSLESANGQPARIAEHYEQGGQARQAAPWWVRAAEAAERIFAYREALLHYRKAMHHVSESNCFDICCKRIKLSQMLDDREGWIEDLGIASNLSTHFGDTSAQIEVAILNAEYEETGRQYANSLNIIENALNQNGITNVQKIRLYIVYSHALVGIGRLNEAESYLIKLLQYVHEEHFVYLGKVYRELSGIARRKNELSKAENWIDEACGCFEKSHMFNEKLECIYGKGEVSYFMRKIHNSIEIFLYILHHIQQSNYFVLEKWCIYNLSRAYLDINDLRNSEFYLNKAKDILQFTDDKGYKAYILAMEAKIDIYHGRIIEGIRKLQESSDITKEIKSISEGYFDQIEIIICLVALNCYSEAKKVILNINIDRSSEYYYLETNWLSIARKIIDLNLDFKSDLTDSDINIISQNPPDYAFLSYRIATYLLNQNRLNEFELIYGNYDKLEQVSCLFYALKLQFLVKKGEMNDEHLREMEQYLSENQIPILERIEIELSLTASIGCLGEKYYGRLEHRKEKTVALVKKTASVLPSHLGSAFLEHHLRHLEGDQKNLIETAPSQ